MAHELGHEGFGAAGAAGMDSNYGQGMGVLTTLGGSAEAGQQAMAYANQLYPQVAEADPWEAAFQFFAEMGKQASVPGATALGAAAGSLSVPVNYLQAKKAEKRETDRARMTAAIQLAPSLKADVTSSSMSPVAKLNADLKAGRITQIQFDALVKKATNIAGASKSTGTTTVGIDPDNLEALRTLLNLPKLSADAIGNVIIPNSSVEVAVAQGLVIPKKSAPRQGVEKYLQQDRVMYMTEADAIKKLKLFDVTTDNPEYSDLLALMTTDDENLIGRPVIQADSYLSFYIPRAGTESEFNVVTRTPGGSPVPAEVTARNEEIKRIIPIQMKQRQVMNDLLPTLESAMSVLMQNPDITGLFQQSTMRIRNFMQSTFGYGDDELSNQRYLEAISNKLAPQMRPIGSGATSDMEFKAYKSAILSMDNPAIANYLTLYSLDKTTRNAAAELAMRKRLLIAGKSETYIVDKISELDKGIYSKFDGADDKDENGDFLYNTRQEYTTARDAWKNNLPSGSVILNKDSSGDKIYPNAGTFIIKDWRGTN